MTSIGDSTPGPTVARSARSAKHDIAQRFIRPHCPWQNGKVERFNRTLQTEISAGLANTCWCLDGRWAIHDADGIKQPEQFCHTAWHYDAHFTRRGDFRRGMPIHGRPDSEHGWAQALPMGALLEQGHATLDWPTGRVASLPGWRARAEREQAGLMVEIEGDGAETLSESQVLLRVLRPPHGQDIEVTSGTSSSVLSWPATLVSLPLDVTSGPTLLTALGR